MFYKLNKNLRRVKLMYHKTENQNKFFPNDRMLYNSKVKKYE